MEDAAAQESIGDRVERAIERRVDTVGEIDRGEQEKPRSLRRNVIWLAITAVSLYLVFPSLVETFASWRQITQFQPLALLLMFALQVGVCACLWDLQRVALKGATWRPVIAAQLASNALSNIAPGGGPIGAALQYRIFVAAGLRRNTVASSLTAVNLLVLATVLGLPVLAIPTVLTVPVNRNLLDAAGAAVAAFTVIAVFGALMLRYDAPLRWVGTAVQAVRNRLRRHSQPLTGLAQRLLHDRDQINTVLEARWKRALALTVGRWILDFMTLQVALAAVGSHPRPALALMAFCGAKALGNIPITPGGLGFVEAGMTALLALAGVSAADAVVATFAYRLFSYWLPLPFGLLGMWLAPRPARTT
ncbi:MAG: flippase-like domain-containing protein [Nocardioidaceae bacterium]|nr:flippase-like domain-containing protein [Nocardioidaceae bacterium]MCL2613646.1 flippase-like domain-containing protein [Nocardioidaceae bacterium]